MPVNVFKNMLYLQTQYPTKYVSVYNKNSDLKNTWSEEILKWLIDIFGYHPCKQTHWHFNPKTKPYDIPHSIAETIIHWKCLIDSIFLSETVIVPAKNIYNKLILFVSKFILQSCIFCVCMCTSLTLRSSRKLCTQVVFEKNKL